MNKNSSESFSPGYCEYLVPGFVGKKLALMRVLALLFGLVFLGVLFALMSKVPQIFAVFLVLIFSLEVIFFRMTSREFEYTVAMGEMTVDAIYGRKIRRKMVSVKISDADKIFPIDGFGDSEISRLGAKKIIYASPKKSDYMYCLYVGKKDAKTSDVAIVFSSCKKLNDSIKFYNRAALEERK